MADDERCAAERLQLLLQQFDGRHVEMVGRLVQQQDVRIMREGMGKGDAPRLPARRLGQVEIERHAPGAQLGLRPVEHVRVQLVRDIIQRRREARKVRLLQQMARHHAGLHEDLAVVRLDRPAKDAHQGRLAGAIAPDQRHPFPAREREVHAREQGRSAQRQHHAAKNSNRRSSHARMDPNRGGRSSGWRRNFRLPAKQAALAYSEIVFRESVPASTSASLKRRSSHCLRE